VLHVEVTGSGSRLALVHGFTQSGRTWGPAGEELGRRYQIVALDAPGHGRSSSVAADLPGGADLMADALSAHGGPAAWIGYSMGGRFALHVALRHPRLVEKLVLVSTTAGLDDPAERQARRESDEALADRVEAEGVEPFLRWWLAQPLFATLPDPLAQVETRLDGSAAGLAESLRRAGTGTQDPLWEHLADLEMPVLVVAGELDTKYRALADRLHGAIGSNSTVAVIEGAGHACHLEKPVEFVQTVCDWL
jgi:2-succinyl-6-hydroxy-2,4-cyclohexadiene-1-carboxylate synthase